MVTVSVAFQTDKPVGAYAALAARAEALGFDGVSVFHDLGFQPSLPALLEMAAATSRVRLGVACLNPGLLHPVEIAGQAAALWAASGGRSYLGLARGAWLDQVGAHSSLRALDECAQVVRRLLTGDDSGFAGEIFPLAQGFRLQSPPGAVPLLLGTWGPRGLALAARVADEVKLGGCANPDMIALARKRLDEAGGEHVGLVAGAVTVCDESSAAALALARAEVELYLPVVAALDETVDLPDGELPDEVLRRFVFAGDPGQIASQAEACVAAGASRIEFGTPHGADPAHGLDLLGSVLGELR